MKWLLLFAALSCSAQDMNLRNAAYVAGLVNRRSAAVLPTANLVLQLKGDSITNLVDGSPIVFWTNSAVAGSSFNNNGVPTAAPTTRLANKNGLTAVEFDGTSDVLQTSVGPVTTSTNYSIYVACKFNSASGSEYIMLNGITTGGFGIGKNAGNRTIIHRAVASCDDGAVTTDAQVWTAIRNTTPVLKFYTNGVEVTISNSTSDCKPPDVECYVGAFTPALGFFFGGFLYELLVYSTAQSASDQAAVEAYLKAKWAIP